MKAENEILKELEAIGSTLGSMPRAMRYSLPDKYFEQLPGAVLDTVYRKEGLIRADLTTDVPKGYFEAFPDQVLAAAKKANKKSVVVPLYAQVRWAAAAVVLLCIGIGSYMIFSNQPASGPEKMLASVSQNEIQEYLQTTDKYYSDKIPNEAVLGSIELDKEAIIQYLNETGWD